MAAVAVVGWYGKLDSWRSAVNPLLERAVTVMKDWKALLMASLAAVSPSR